MKVFIKRLAILLLIAGVGFGFDFWLKSYVHHYVFLPVHIFHFSFIEFTLEHVTNTGGAWGMFAGHQFYLLTFRIILVMALMIYTCFRPFREQIGFVLVTTGALCNIFDTFYYGHVIDMLHFTFWFHSYGIFNLADSYIFIGTLALFFVLMRKKQDASVDCN